MTDPDLRSSRTGKKQPELPPHSPEAERGALSCVLQEAPEALPALVTLGVTSDAFYDLRHRAIFDALVELNSAGKPVDLLTLSNRLSESRQLEAVGGPIYLSDIEGAAPSAANAPYYAEILLERQTLRRAIEACQSSILDLRENPGEAEAALQRMDRRISEVRPSHAGQAKSMQEVVQLVIDRMEREFEGVATGIPTGLADLDAELDTGGLRQQDLVILAGRPQCGKTALGCQLVATVCQRLATEWSATRGEEPYTGPIVLFFSLEMSAEAVARRMVGHIAQVNMRMKGLTEADVPRLHQATYQAASWPLIIDDSPGHTTESIRGRSLTIARGRPVQMVVIDYLQLIGAAQGSRHNSRQEEMAEASRRMKGLAKELRCPVICVAALNREADRERNRSPRMSDLRESGQIEYDADLILFLHPRKSGDDDAVYSTGPSPMWLTIGKQRDGPSQVPIALNFNRQMQTFFAQSKVAPDDDDQSEEQRWK